jgi:molybdenum cofactor biosynthesis enzyme MoaA
MKIETFSILAGTRICDAHCPFCISRMTGIEETGYKEPEVNWRNFHKACNVAKISDVSTVLITGKGESTLYPEQISKYLQHLERYNFPFIEIQTNGIRLEKKWNEYEKYLNEWYSRGMTMICLSVVHYSKEKNKQIYTPKSEYMDLENLIKKLHNIGFSVRLGCTLIKGYIDSVSEVCTLIDFAKNNKVEQLTLRELRVEEVSEDIRVQRYCQRNQLFEYDFNSIKDWLINNGRLLMTLPHNAKIYDVDKQNVCIVDCEMLQPLSGDIRTLIFFPDGHLRYNWEYGGAILL